MLFLFLFFGVILVFLLISWVLDRELSEIEREICD